MKCIFVLASMACVLNCALLCSAQKAEEAHSEVMSYVAGNMGSIRMMRSNRAHLECYNGFLPLINSLAQKAKEKSNACVNDADERKDQAIASLNRTDVAVEVKKITDSLADCTNQKDLEYFICLEANTKKNMQIMETIKNKSQQVIAQNAALVRQIDADEHSCIIAAVDKAKNESDMAFDKLKSCINGEATFENYVWENNSSYNLPV